MASIDILEQLAQDARKAGNFIAEKAVMAKDYTAATWSAAELRNQIEARYQQIGKAVYFARKEGKEAELEAEFAELDTLIAAWREKENARREICNRKSCPSCNQAIAKDHIFCPYCGKDLN